MFSRASTRYCIATAKEWGTLHLASRDSLSLGRGGKKRKKSDQKSL